MFRFPLLAQLTANYMMDHLSQTKLNMFVVCKNVKCVDTLFLISPPQAYTLSASIRGSQIHLLISRASGTSQTIELI